MSIFIEYIMTNRKEAKKNKKNESLSTIYYTGNDRLNTNPQHTGALKCSGRH